MGYAAREATRLTQLPEADADGWVAFERRPIWHVQIRRPEKLRQNDGVSGETADLPAPHSPLRVPMHIDTGADMTMFAPDIWAHIGARPTGARLEVLGGEGLVLCDEYVVDLVCWMTVPDQACVYFPGWRVYERVMSRDPRLLPENIWFGGLLGMDVLRHVRLTVDRERFKIEDPRQAGTDSISPLVTPILSVQNGTDWAGATVEKCGRL